MAGVKWGGGGVAVMGWRVKGYAIFCLVSLFSHTQYSVRFAAKLFFGISIRSFFITSKPKAEPSQLLGMIMSIHILNKIM